MIKTESKRIHFSFLVILLMLLLACNNHDDDDDDDTGDNDDDNDDTDWAEYPENDDIWLDDATGLMWQIETARNLTWETSDEYCKNLEQQGFTDWRMPTISKLRTLIRGCPGTKTGGSCTITDTCLDRDSCWDDSCYGCEIYNGPAADGCFRISSLLGPCQGEVWTSSELPGGERYLWIVRFNLARINTLAERETIESSMPYRGSVRCVRVSD